MKNFILRQIASWKLKDLPEGQREQILALLERDPDLMKKIGEEIERRVKKGGEPKMRATVEVMKKYRNELSSAFQN